MDIESSIEQTHEPGPHEPRQPISESSKEKLRGIVVSGALREAIDKAVVDIPDLEV